LYIPSLFVFGDFFLLLIRFLLIIAPLAFLLLLNLRLLGFLQSQSSLYASESGSCVLLVSLHNRGVIASLPLAAAASAASTPAPATASAAAASAPSAATAAATAAARLAATARVVVAAVVAAFSIVAAVIAAAALLVVDFAALLAATTIIAALVAAVIAAAVVVAATSAAPAASLVAGDGSRVRLLADYGGVGRLDYCSRVGRRDLLGEPCDLSSILDPLARFSCSFRGETSRGKADKGKNEEGTS
ncbi:hypothetical protein PENTCL1PPCAC_25588, partial [Pristionchus entomophagus]